MLMESLERGFSSSSPPSDIMSLSFPLTPESQLPQYSECLQTHYTPIQYDDGVYQPYGGSQTSLDVSSPSPSPLDTPLHHTSYPQRTSLSSVSSYSSDASCPVLSSTSQSSGLSDIASFSSMSISSDTSSSSSSLFSNPPQFSNPFNSTRLPSTARAAEGKTRRVNSGSKPLRFNYNSSGSVDTGVPRRSSAPARGTSAAAAASRKDSFVYDVQLETDNVLLFVPDLDLVKSHLMLAVREEVDVLKERIGELMERINHLEYENSVLKKYATPETLQQIQHSGPNP